MNMSGPYWCNKCWINKNRQLSIQKNSKWFIFKKKRNRGSVMIFKSREGYSYRNAEWSSSHPSVWLLEKRNDIPDV